MTARLEKFFVASAVAFGLFARPRLLFVFPRLRFALFAR